MREAVKTNIHDVSRVLYGGRDEINKRRTWRVLGGPLAERGQRRSLGGSIHVDLEPWGKTT